MSISFCFKYVLFNICLQSLEERSGASGFVSVPKTADPVSCGATDATDGSASSPLPLARIRGPQACSGAGYGSSGQGEVSEPYPVRSQSPGPRDEPAHTGPELDGSVLANHRGVRPGVNQRFNGKFREAFS